MTMTYPSLLQVLEKRPFSYFLCLSERLMIDNHMNVMQTYDQELFQSPTGFGKTVFFLCLSDRLMIGNHMNVVLNLWP